MVRNRSIGPVDFSPLGAAGGGNFSQPLAHCTLLRVTAPFSLFSLFFFHKSFFGDLPIINWTPRKIVVLDMNPDRRVQVLSSQSF